MSGVTTMSSGTEDNRTYLMPSHSMSRNDESVGFYKNNDVYEAKLLDDDYMMILSIHNNRCLCSYDVSKYPFLFITI
jgi:hypothetical protein